MDASPDVDPRIDPALAQALHAAAREQLGQEMDWYRIGYSEYRSESSYSVTCAATSPALLAIAELRVRAGTPQAVITQVLPRAAVTQVAACEGRTYALIPDAHVYTNAAQEAGFHIEGPLLSLPDRTAAHKVLPRTA